MDLFTAHELKEAAIVPALRELLEKGEAVLDMASIEAEWNCLPLHARGNTPFVLLEDCLRMVPSAKWEGIGGGKVRLRIER
ncbi:hypothetical protein [Mesoterricola silvestris]|uniref:Uncharacterized protein n=1 Tax=Mesoterricola silvestris TaxID=2927979 RepID=A0AA48GXS5_9BACT|nr:hypothetical protein [Mesoterricola silvestris]BDU72313.1 hypothetical protein METEAL_14870 [Mesoterricola silvestris]